MMKSVLLSLIVLFISQNAFAQTKPTCACCTESHQLFDFWVGNWVVSDTLGKQIGESIIEKLEDDCVISEQWKSSGGYTGRSYNYYDAADSSWNQVWLDHQGANLILKGKGSKNKMVLRSKLSKDPKGNEVYNQITWTKESDGSVIQIWDVLNVKEKPIQRLFKGIYRKSAK
ncbi:hypothetical protein [Limnoraphis robusta]|uniref:DUF1579 domain-containing protein n=1 Tax=Limnoraphis robusta CCNP1315 TaxID=3110306 RepID=A0ABU5U9M7_9CYAN|nr:hypothetical protein [Limnoraphis robusta]MEA5523338.1 hypothetical protein [Limnoraphis robusta CCNP1315]